MPKNTRNTHDSSTAPLMRTLALIGTCFFLAGIFLFTRGPAWHFGYVISGSVVGLLGLLILGLTASQQQSSVPARSSRSKGRIRRRPSAEIRSLRTRRVVITGAGR
jgi:hypothetical protein